MPSVKLDSGHTVDLGQLDAPLNFYESKITYKNEKTNSMFEMQRTADPRLLGLTLLGNKNQGEADRTASVKWSNSSESVRAGFKRKFNVSSSPLSPVFGAVGNVMALQPSRDGDETVSAGLSTSSTHKGFVANRPDGNMAMSHADGEWHFTREQYETTVSLGRQNLNLPLAQRLPIETIQNRAGLNDKEAVVAIFRDAGVPHRRIIKPAHKGFVANRPNGNMAMPHADGEWHFTREQYEITVSLGKKNLNLPWAGRLPIETIQKQAGLNDKKAVSAILRHAGVPNRKILTDAERVAVGQRWVENDRRPAGQRLTMKAFAEAERISDVMVLQSKDVYMKAQGQQP